MFRDALRFFTRLPLGAPSATASFQGVVAWMPAVGLIVGLIMAGTLGLCATLLPTPLCGLSTCLVWIAVTGGLHLDGVADCGDGLFVEASRERRLEIMQDSRLGAFGVIALFFVLALKSTALALLGSGFVQGAYGFWTLLAVCALAATLGRCAVFAAARLPSARPGGMGAAASAGISRRHERIALAVVLALCLVTPRGFRALLAALLVACCLLLVAKRRLGGVTGDVFGCLVEITECATLLVGV